MSTENENETKAVESTAKPKPAKAEKATGGATAIPPCPPEDPLAGDKTPEVVAWWFKHHPKEAEEKYKGRKFARPE